MKKQRSKMVFRNPKERDMTIKQWADGSYEIDKKNPLIVWLNF